LGELIIVYLSEADQSTGALATIVSLIVFCITVYYSGQKTFYYHNWIFPAHYSLRIFSKSHLFLVVITSLPIVAIWAKWYSLVAIRADYDDSGATLIQAIADRLFGAALSLTLSVSLFIAISRFLFAYARKYAATYWRQADVAMLVLCCLLAAFFVLAVTWRPTVLMRVGLLSAIVALMALLLFIFTEFFWLSRRRFNPWFIVVIGSCYYMLYGATTESEPMWQRAAAFSTASTTGRVGWHAGVKAEFMRWLDARRGDIETFSNQGRSFPVYLFGLQGGGLYAAYHSAIFLGNVQDRCPRFANHIFGIVGTSGGALGAATFVGALGDTKAADLPVSCGTTKEGDDRTVRLVREYLRRDYLSPIVSAVLFRELINVITPRNSRRQNRASVWELAASQSWNEVVTSATQAVPAVGPVPKMNFFERSMGSLWDPTLSRPALFFTSTIMDTGQVLMLSTLKWPAPDQDRIPFVGWDEVLGGFDLTLVQGVSISARYPVVMPAAEFIATVESSDRDRYIRLIDGGVHETSEVDAVMRLEREVLQAVKGTEYEQKVRISVVLFGVTSPERRIGAREANVSGPEGDLIQLAHETRNIRRMTRLAEMSRERPDIRIVLLGTGGFNPPLTWALSDTVFRELEMRAGFSGLAGTYDAHSAAHRVYERNDLISQAMIREMSSK
jgi:hypothetical protein